MDHPDWPGLQRYLRAVWDEPALELVGTPYEAGGGYSRTIWSLELASSKWPASRTYQVRCSDAVGSELTPEIDRLRWLVDRGYPVSRPICSVRDASVIGRPFAMLEWVAGPSLAEIVQAMGWGRDGLHARTIGNLLARLHAIPSPGFPVQMNLSHQMPGFDRISGLLDVNCTGLLKELIGTYRTQPSSDVVCHLDLHPRNIIMASDGAHVIDWEKAARAHPLADIAMAQIHTEIAIALGEYPVPDESLIFGDLLIEGYLRSRSIDCRDLGFFRLLAACQRLGDVAGALQRPVLLDGDRAELHAEGRAAIAIIDREIDQSGISKS